MKKILTFVLALAMIASLAACGSSGKTSATDTDIGSGVVSEPVIEPTSEPVDEPVDEPASEPVDEPTDEPVVDTSTSPDDMSLDDILSTLLSVSGFEASSFYQSNPVTAEDAGYVTGFDGIDTGFEEALGYGPAIGSIPFSMVIFRLAEGADAEAFAADLKDGANPGKWICVCADAVETAVSGRTVLFIMSDTDSAEAFTSAFSSLGK